MNYAPAIPLGTYRESEIWGEIPPSGPDPIVATSLPPAGPGFYCKNAQRTYAHPATLRAVTVIAAEWQRLHPQGPRIGITDISLPGGGPMPPHKSHQHGLDVDIRPMRSDGREEAVSYTMPGYSQQLTQELVTIIRANRVLAVSRVFFNDSRVGGVSPLVGHHNHLHVTFSSPPAGPQSYVPSKLYSAPLTAAPGEWEIWGEIPPTNPPPTGQPPASQPPAIGPDQLVTTSLPPAGPGFYCKDAQRAYAHRETLRAVIRVAAIWQRLHPKGPRIGITDISLPGGGPMPPHKSHQHGLDVDIRPMRNDGREDRVVYTDPAYSRELTQELINLFKANRVLKVSKILFNDPLILGVVPVSGHDDHFHVTFGSPPTGLGSYVSYLFSESGAVPSSWPAGTFETQPATTTPDDLKPDGPHGAGLGVLVAPAADGRTFSYQFTPADRLWTARFLVGEAGGRDDPDNRAVLWTMFNLYGLVRHHQYPTFHAFLRGYSTPLQPALRNWRAARRHQRDPEFLGTGGTYPPPAPPGIRVGQLKRFLRLQNTPWSELPAPAKSLASKALADQIENPIGNATQFDNTAVYFRDRHGRLPNDVEWLRFTQDFARSSHYRWIGHRAGLNQRNNTFFVEERFASLPPKAVRIRPPRQ